MIVAAAPSSPTILDSAMAPRVIANVLMSIMATALLFCCIREDGRAMREEETYTLGQSHSFGQKYFTPFASRVQTKDHERPSRRKGVVAFEKRPRRVVSRRSTARVKQSGRRGHKMRSFLEFPPPGNLSDHATTKDAPTAFAIAVKYVQKHHPEHMQAWVQFDMTTTTKDDFFLR